MEQRIEQMQMGGNAVTIFPLEYQAIVVAGLASAEPVSDTLPSVDHNALMARIAELEREMEERTRAFEAAMQTARNEAQEAGWSRARNEQSERLAAASQSLKASLGEFVAARDHYLAQVEQEVVRLALAIAARVLHREAMMDPLLLAGAVRVALGQLAETTEVRLKVPAAEFEMWREMLELMPSLPLHPEVVADDALHAGECLLETRLGSVDLGVRGQLAEIERGFFDLLEHRGAAADHESSIAQRQS